MPKRRHLMAGSEGCSAFRNNAGVDEPLQKVVPELCVFPPPRKHRVVSWVDSSQDKEQAMRRSRGVPLRRGRWTCDRPCPCSAGPASNAGRATEGPNSQDHEGGRPVCAGLALPSGTDNPAHDGLAWRRCCQPPTPKKLKNISISGKRGVAPGRRSAGASPAATR